ncbi:MAG: ATP-binding protein [Synergistaceae bacterium]|jgi:anti-sigma regulatory factor (Ser/Thr protein kinase)|nr:ATP-binding protein [Synergistaceae bacterium]
MKELEVNAEIENLDAVLEFIGGEISGLLAKTRNKILIAAEEIFVNIALYAYKSGIGKAVIRIAGNGDTTIEFEDSGVPYDPLQKDDPDITLSAEEREIGGLGIFMAKSLMDDISYRREGNKNILTIRKERGKVEA